MWPRIIEFVFLPALVIAATPAQVLVGIGVLRHEAERVVMPEYPSVSFVDGHKGPAVAEVRVSIDGKVAHIRMLEAPDQAIAESVSSAVQKWRFHPFSVAGRAVEVISRVVFYFRIVDGKPFVIDEGNGARKPD